MERVYAYLLSAIVMIIVYAIPNSVTIRATDSAWYTCVKPTITPPKYVFPIVWTILYIFIGIALAQALMAKPSYERNILLGMHLWNLVLNVLWSFIYFGQHDVMLALFVLFNMIIATIFILHYTYLTLPVWVFWLLLPYIGWLYFAALLNFLSSLKKC